jgi:translation initiation factor IF-3
MFCRAPPKAPLGVKVRVNGQIHASEVRVVGAQGRQLGVMPLSEALELAKSKNIDLVEIAPTAKPPVCRLIDYGKFRSDLSKKKKRKK